MNKHTVQRELDEDDIYQLMELIKTLNLDNKQEYYLQPTADSASLDLLFIRSGLFDYSLFGFGRFNNNVLTSVILFTIPVHKQHLKYAFLHFGNFEKNIDFKDPLICSIKSLSRNYPDLVKVKINCGENSISKTFIDSICEIGFIKELDLIDEMGLGNNLQTFSLSI